MTTTKQDLIAAGRRRYRDIDTSWGAKLRLQTLTQREYATIEDQPQAERLAWYIVYCLVDNDGNRIWGEHELDDVRALNVSVVNELIQHIGDFTTEEIGPEKKG